MCRGTTTACHLVHGGVDINTNRAWLGHVSVDTTDICAEIDLDAQAQGIALFETDEVDPHRPWKEKPGLMSFPKSL